MSNLGNQSADNIQILQLHAQGANAEQIGEMLGKDPKIVGLIIQQQIDARRKLSLNERYGDLKDIAIQALKEVAQYSEQDGARVQAAKILIDEVEGNNTTAGNMKFDYSELASRLLTAQARVDQALESKENTIVEIPKEYKNAMNNEVKVDATISEEVVKEDKFAVEYKVADA